MIGNELKVYDGLTARQQLNLFRNLYYNDGNATEYGIIANAINDFFADVVPKSEVEKIFEKLKVRECSNSVCTWCVHANAYGRRNEECDKPYIDKNGKEQKACYAYAKFESLIDKELAELKKKYQPGQEQEGEQCRNT